MANLMIILITLTAFATAAKDPIFTSRDRLEAMTKFCDYPNNAVVHQHNKPEVEINEALDYLMSFCSFSSNDQNPELIADLNLDRLCDSINHHDGSNLILTGDSGLSYLLLKDNIQSEIIERCGPAIQKELDFIRRHFSSEEFEQLALNLFPTATAKQKIEIFKHVCNVDRFVDDQLFINDILNRCQELPNHIIELIQIRVRNAVHTDYNLFNAHLNRLIGDGFIKDVDQRIKQKITERPLDLLCLRSDLIFLALCGANNRIPSPLSALIKRMIEDKVMMDGNRMPNDHFMASITPLLIAMTQNIDQTTANSCFHKIIGCLLSLPPALITEDGPTDHFISSITSLLIAMTQNIDEITAKSCLTKMIDSQSTPPPALHDFILALNNHAFSDLKDRLYGVLHYLLPREIAALSDPLPSRDDALKWVQLELNQDQIDAMNAEMNAILSLSSPQLATLALAHVDMHSVQPSERWFCHEILQITTRDLNAISSPIHPLLSMLIREPTLYPCHFQAHIRHLISFTSWSDPVIRASFIAAVPDLSAPTTKALIDSISFAYDFATNPKLKREDRPTVTSWSQSDRVALAPVVLALVRHGHTLSSAPVMECGWPLLLKILGMKKKTTLRSNEFKFDSLLSDMLRILPLKISKETHREAIKYAIEICKGELSKDGQAEVALELLKEQAGKVGQRWYKSSSIFTLLRDIIEPNTQ